MAKTARKSQFEAPGQDQGRARNVLLSAGKKLFARQGLTATTIRDIASEAQMNSSQISYYFAGKEGLYRACIEDIARPLVRLADQILQAPRSREDFQVRLRLFVESFFNNFLEDQDAGLIMIREYDRPHSPAEDVFKSRFIQLFDAVKSFFQAASGKSYIRKNIDIFTLNSLFFGALMHELRFDHIKFDIYKKSLRNPKERALIVEHIVDLYSPN
jgi:AcrR family transcriptional regulator